MFEADKRGISSGIAAGVGWQRNRSDRVPQVYNTSTLGIPSNHNLAR